MDAADRFYAKYIEEYLAGDATARFMANALKTCGVGLMPLVDHCAIRTHDVGRRALEFLDMGFSYDEKTGTLEYENWWAKVYRKPGYPALFIDQGFAGVRGRESLIPAWVDAFGDEIFHHCAIRVEDIPVAVKSMKAHGFKFADAIIGGPGSDLRQIFSKPEIKNGLAFTVLELLERRNGYAGFLPPQADGLMESTRL